MEHEHEYLVQAATLNEYLGQHDIAVPLYLEAASYGDRRIHVRLLNLYEAAGQTEALLEILRQEDLAYGALSKKYPSPETTPTRRSPVSETVHRIFELRALEAGQQWTALLKVIHPGLQENGAQRAQFEIDEVAKILARHPADSMPLLQEGLEEGTNFPTNKYYALGLIGTPEAVAALKKRAAQETNYYLLSSLVRDLGLAGENGTTAMSELYLSAQGNLKAAIERYRSGTLYTLRPKDPLERRAFPFPSIPQGLKLPVGCRGFYPNKGYVCQIAAK